MIELFVGLKIADNTAITTKHTLERMGFDIGKVRRNFYYRFDITGDEEEFKKKISKVDILINANKNIHSFDIQKDEGNFCVLVMNLDDDCEELLHILRERLGLAEIKSMQRGVLWELGVDSNGAAEKIAKELLCNENYQEAMLVR